MRMVIKMEGGIMDCCSNKKSMMEKIKLKLGKNKIKEHGESSAARKVVLIGNPNVGKSVIFNSLTGAYVTVSNYPGTTVEVSRGWYISGGKRHEIIDTPGMYSMLPISEEEAVTRKLILSEKPDLMIHVVDAKNIGRMLPLTLQLIETGLPVVLVLNIMDEAKMLGVDINRSKLQDILGIPVIETSAAMNLGIDELKKIIKEYGENAA